MRQKSAIGDLVRAYFALGYCAADIGKALGRSPQRIRQVMREQGLVAPRIRTEADIPESLRNETLRFRNC